ncbi:MAG: ribonuclease III [Desulfobulbaceae bacterium]|nr:ribonuclease III [Desulfobulbaceae bacterium]
MAATLDTLIQDNQEQLAAIQEKIGYAFHNLHFLQLALIHSSFAFERMKDPQHNETQEFLGDAVLDLAVGYILFTRFPEMREGKLTRIRAALVNEAGLADMARKIHLGDYLLLGHGENTSKGREKPSILACAYEALVGAVYLDSGYDEALVFVRRWFDPLIDRYQELLMTADSKSALQELLQEKYNEGPLYLLEKEEGPPHARLFTVSVQFRGKTLGTGRASSKKEAEQKAAAEALDCLHT